MAKYSDDQKADIVDRALKHIANGKPLTEFCRENDYPYMTVTDWLKSDAVFPMYARARDIGTDYLAQDCITVSENVERKIRETPELATQLIAAARLVIDTRLRLIGKWNRKDYGDKAEDRDSDRDDVVVYNSPSHDSRVDDTRVNSEDL